MANSPNFQFTPEDQAKPTFCFGCYIQIPKAVADSCQGLCPMCFAKGGLTRTTTPTPVRPEPILPVVSGVTPTPPTDAAPYWLTLVQNNPVVTGLVVLVLIVWLSVYVAFLRAPATPTAATPPKVDIPENVPDAKPTVSTEPAKPAEPVATSAPTEPQGPDLFENLASQMMVVSTVLDQQRGPDFVDTATGSFLHIHWVNKSKRPIREVWAIITVRDDNGIPIDPYDNLRWCLYYESKPIAPGASGWDHEQINNWPVTSESENRPATANVTIVTATEGQQAPDAK